MKNILMVFLFSSLFFSCSTSQHEESKGFYNLIETKEFTFELESNSKSIVSMLQYYEKGNDSFFINLNRLQNKLDFYNVEGGELEKSIRFHNEGENGVGAIRSFYFHSPDSIFLLGSYNLSVSIVDSNSIVKKRINYATVFKDQMLQPTAGAGKLLYYSNQKLNIVFQPIIDPENISRIPKYETTGTYDLLTNKFNLDYLKYPIQYTEDYYNIWHVGISRCFDNNGQMKAVFPIQKRVYFRNNEYKEFESDYISSVAPLGKPLVLEATQHFIESSRIGQILYDKFIDKYYLFEYKGVDYKVDGNLTNDASNQPAAVLILDNGLNVVGEAVLPENLAYYSAFVTPMGLCISSNSPANKDLDENKLVIKVFNLKKDEG